MTSAKFYYYNIWVRDEDGHRIPIDNAFSDEVFTQDEYEIDIENNKFYFTKFRFMRANCYYGMLMRAKNEEGFVRLDEDRELSSLSEQTEGEGQTGSIDRDYVNFGIVTEQTEIGVLVQVGYQTPGILKIKEYLAQHIDNDDVDEIAHESRMPDLDEDKARQLMNSYLKSTEISFKNHPDNIPGFEVSETLSNSVPDDYRVKLEISLERSAESQASVIDSLAEIMPGMSTGDDDIVETIRQIDFPRIMNTFKITGVDGETEEEIEMNLAETVEKEEIDISRYGLFDENLGEHLYNKLVQNY